MFRYLKYLFLSFIILGISFYFQEGDKIDHITSLPHELSGNKQSEVMLVFLHGYPNTLRLWDTAISKLKDKYLCLNISYPNFSKELQLKWGMDLQSIARLIKETIYHVGNKNPQIKKKIVVSHDWGAGLTYFLDFYHPKTVDHIITLDVGLGPDESMKGWLIARTYQSYLAASFLIGGPIGRAMTRLFEMVMMKDAYGMTQEDKERWNETWNYFYYHRLRNGGQMYTDIYSSYKPSAGIDYIYAKDKVLQFHNNWFLELLKNTPNSSVTAVSGGHWIMKDHLDLIIEKINKQAK
jgi:pimeloyl-ACP methyl ester carboxylesterase